MSALPVVTRPLCADARRDAVARALVDGAVDLLLAAEGADALEAVVLTGSLSRGEGSVLFAPEGPRLLGDVELLVLLRWPFDFAAARRRMAALGREASARASRHAPPAAIEYAPAGVDYLRAAIRPSIFAYDLLHHGQVLWGRADVLREARRPAPEEIPAKDALELVMNRIVELRLAEAEDPQARAYHLVKVTLDLAGAALASRGRHASHYAVRPAALRRLLSEDTLLGSALGDAAAFERALEAAVRCKLQPTTALLREWTSDARRRDVVRWARAVWLFQMRAWLGQSAAGASFADLVAAYLAREPLRERARRWVKYWTHPLRPAGRPAPWRLARAAWRGSPHALAYAAALLSCEADFAGRPELRRRAAALLPVPSSEASGGRDAAELWRWLVRNN